MSGQVSGWVKWLVVAVLGLATLYALPNVLTPAQRALLPGFLPNQPMTLGLDLQGGAHLVLEVQTADVLTRAYENLEDTVRQLARTEAIGYANLRTAAQGQAAGVQLLLRDASQRPALEQGLSQERVIVTVGADGETLLQYAPEAIAELNRRALAQTVQVLRSRVDEFGVAEPLIQQQGTNRVIVELPGVQDVNRAKNAIGRTAQLTFHLVVEGATTAAPGQLLVKNEDGSNLVIQRRPSLTGERLTSAAPGFDQMNLPAVDIAFDSRGTKQFAELSTQNVGKRFAIMLDGQVYSAPVFREPILGGRAQISGSFGVQEAQDLAAILNAGALPAKLSVVEERTVGPSLGADSVAAGALALGLGLALVLVFMAVFYGFFGLVANLALIINLIILVAVMTAMGFTLTLPGMAGMVLTLGMAVDANVLIYERMREEVRNGKKPLAAMLAGFQGAWNTIFDSNVCSLVACAVLFSIGTGPIKGFAVSLTIGLLAHMFTAVTLTRWLLLAWHKRAKPTILPV